MAHNSSDVSIGSTQSLHTDLLSSYQTIREYSLALCKNLTEADMQAQSMPDASPVKWHLAHTTWAFETFVLKQYQTNYQPFNSQFEYLFNSYYNAIGTQFPRNQRGLLTRPELSQVLEYRHYVDKFMFDLIHQHIDQTKQKQNNTLIELIKLFINHEQQHQELMLTDLKHLFSFNPLAPKYKMPLTEPSINLDTNEQNCAITFKAGLHTIGHSNEDFYFDNEAPQHQFYINSFNLDSRLVNNKEYRDFIEDDGYQKPQYWLSEAWQTITQNQIKHPLYWRNTKDGWFEHSLAGTQPLLENAAVKHISYFEANAFANWKNKRLPTEQEWEVAAKSNHPQLKQMFNHLWQWTASNYSAYPGFKTAHGATGEYNGKFMVNQYVLRGGSVVTPQHHIRPSYRNFFYPDARWQYSGIRLADSN